MFFFMSISCPNRAHRTMPVQDTSNTFRDVFRWIMNFWSIAAHSITLNLSWAKRFCRNVFDAMKDIHIPCGPSKGIRHSSGGSRNAKWMRTTSVHNQQTYFKGTEWIFRYFRVNHEWIVMGITYSAVTGDKRRKWQRTKQKLKLKQMEKNCSVFTSFSCRKALTFIYSERGQLVRPTGTRVYDSHSTIKWMTFMLS